jgi:hypothetical protein
VVVTDTVVVPLVVPELSVMVPAPPEQVGRSVAPLGDVVNTQLIVTTPAYPVVEATVMVEVALSPGLIADGDDVVTA